MAFLVVGDAGDVLSIGLVANVAKAETDLASERVWDRTEGASELFPRIRRV